jgi:hypothetical protein
MTKPQVQFDPMEQLMALLQFQQRNKQARQQNEMSEREFALREQQLAQQGFASERDFGLREQEFAQQGSLSGRELDLRGEDMRLRGEDMRQRGQQTEAERKWQQEQFIKKNQQWEAEMQEKNLIRALQEARYAKLDPIDEAKKKAEIERLLKPDPENIRTVLEREGLRDRQIEAINQQILSGNIPAYDRQRHIDRLNELLQLKPLRDYTQEELAQQRKYNLQPK